MPRRPSNPLITLTTDFGLQDPFVGVLKGVIWSRCPAARVADLTHQIPPGDLRAGAFVLLTAHRFFPRGAVHLAVVDPGVGGPRSALAARSAQAYFLGPDNGLLSWALEQAGTIEVRRLENDRLWLRPVSATFHGRDVFAPVAAYLASGGRFAALGPRVAEWVRLPWPAPQAHAGGWRGEVLYVDRFGNAITNLPVALVEKGPRPAHLWLPDRRRVPLGAFYGAVPQGSPVVVPGSSGFLEVAVHGGNAAHRFNLRPGTPVFWPAPAPAHEPGKGSGARPPRPAAQGPSGCQRSTPRAGS